MSENERVRTRERAPLKENMYERSLRYYRENNERMERGAIVIKESDREPELSRQGRLVFYMDPRTFPDLPCQQWLVFRHEVSFPPSAAVPQRAAESQLESPTGSNPLVFRRRL